MSDNNQNLTDEGLTLGHDDYSQELANQSNNEAKNTSSEAINNRGDKSTDEVDPIVTKLKKKKLYGKVKNALTKEVTKKIEQGKTANVSLERFIYTLIERGLKEGEG